nr:hypothetical protein [uncultured bacterium]
MKKAAVLSALLLVLFAISAYAQSGRRMTTPVVTPQPAPVQDDDSQYSESKATSGPTYSRKVVSTKPKVNVPVEPKADTSATVDDETIKVDTSLVTIPVSVYEKSGVYVGGLRRNDFKIFEDGKEQEIAYFGTVEMPMSVVLVIDTSPSTSLKIEDIQNAAISFVDHLGPKDKVMVVEFNWGVSIRTEFTNDRSQITKAIRKTGFGNGTALYDAVETVLKKKLTGIEGRKAVILFTDGVDTVSRGNGYEKTLAMAEESEAVILPVYYNTYLDMKGIGRGGAMSTPPTLGVPQSQGGPSAEDYALGRTYLLELARVTGGQMFRAESTAGGLNAAFDGIAQELSNQYSIGYYPNEPGASGQRKQIKVRVNRPNVAVRARDNYIVGATEDGKKGK